MRIHPLLLVVIVISVAVSSAGCGGSSLGTVPRGAATPMHARAVHQVVVRLHGRPNGTARLRPADAGQKTAVGLSLRNRDGSALTAALAHGSCRKPTGLTVAAMLGRVRSRETSWTLPTPFAQLRSSAFVVVVRSADRPVAACGEPRP
jgi:hypothetical protein